MKHNEQDDYRPLPIEMTQAYKSYRKEWKKCLREDDEKDLNGKSDRPTAASNEKTE